MRREQPNHKLNKTIPHEAGATKQKKTTNHKLNPTLVGSNQTKENADKPILWAKRDSSFLGVTALVGNPA